MIDYQPEADTVKYLYLPSNFTTKFTKVGTKKHQGLSELCGCFS
jgi:hypothetical protein